MRRTRTSLFQPPLARNNCGCAKSASDPDGCAATTYWYWLCSSIRLVNRLLAHATYDPRAHADRARSAARDRTRCRFLSEESPGRRGIAATPARRERSSPTVSGRASFSERLDRTVATGRWTYC